MSAPQTSDEDMKRFHFPANAFNYYSRGKKRAAPKFTHKLSEYHLTPGKAKTTR